LIDVGCKKDSYCADMTRTFFYQSVSEKQREVYELVKKANEAAESMIKPGVRFCDIDKTARDIISKAGYGEKFTHRLGHSIGIEVHEYGDVSSINETKVKPGMIFSIEPGIYLEGEFGVRIEDLVLVTEDGVQLLNHYSKELTVIH
jgi:Xaa-Pro dipeptidase